MKGLINKDRERNILRNSLTTKIDLEELKREIVLVLYII
jgi:hypothetical protein